MSNSMMYMMPVMSVMIAIVAPLGLALYWLMSNILMIIERLVINKIMKKIMMRRNLLMAKSIISEGKTSTEAIENGLKQLKVSKDKVEIKILESEEKRSFLVYQLLES